LGPTVTSALRRVRDDLRLTRPHAILHRLRVESLSSSSTAGPQSRHEHSEAMSISVASCTIKDNRLQLRRGLNRSPSVFCLLRTYLGADASRICSSEPRALSPHRQPVIATGKRCEVTYGIQTRRQSKMVWRGELSSNHRERVRFESLRRRRQICRPVRRVLAPSAKLFAATFFSASLPNCFLHCLIAAAIYGVA
jgi:hypothetical protein